MAQALQRHQGGWAVLYHLSTEDAPKPLFMAQLPMVYQHFIHTKDFRNAPELLALAANLTHDRSIAEVGDHCARRITWWGLLLNKQMLTGVDLEEALPYRIKIC